jgi:hypothetical protein
MVEGAWTRRGEDDAEELGEKSILKRFAKSV